jgi:hypothetical protein
MRPDVCQAGSEYSVEYRVRQDGALAVRVASVSCPKNAPYMGEARMRLLSFNEAVEFIYRMP